MSKSIEKLKKKTEVPIIVVEKSIKVIKKIKNKKIIQNLDTLIIKKIQSISGLENQSEEELRNQKKI